MPLATFADLGYHPDSDWIRHVWATEYFQRYFMAHHVLPVVVNTPEAIGLVFPQFYAFPLYAAGAFVAIAIGPTAALCSLVMAASLIFASQAFLTVLQLTGSRAAALVVTLAVSTAPYGLTDVFSRGAIPEYEAVALVSAATCAWLRFAFASPPNSRDAWLAFLFYSVGASMHPITALLGGLFCGATFVAAAFAGERLKPALQIAVPAAILALAVLSPWLYTVARFAHDTSIVTGNRIVYVLGIDTVANRLSALPRDIRVENVGLTTTPYLDAQVNFALLALAALLAADTAWRLLTKKLTWSRPLALATGFSTVFIVLVFASSSPAVGAILFYPVSMLQYVYRTTSYMDLLLLSTTVVLLYMVSGNTLLFERRVPAMLLVCGLLAFHNGLVKTAHTVKSAVHGPDPLGSSRALSLPFNYPTDDYTTSGRSLPSLPGMSAMHMRLVTLPVADGAAFGTVGTAHIFAPHDQVVTTNVASFVTNDILVDGKRVAASDRFVDDDVKAPYRRLAVRLTRGEHTLGFAARTTSLAVALRIIALLALVILVWLAARPHRSFGGEGDSPDGVERTVATVIPPWN